MTRCSITGAKICLTSNPAGGPSHWFHRRFCEGGATVIRSTMLGQPRTGRGLYQ